MLHIGISTSKRPAGLGNEIFPIAKCLIGNQLFPGQVLLPNYSLSFHAFPKFIGQFSTHKFTHEDFPSHETQLTPNQNFLILGRDTFTRFGDSTNRWDYGQILEKVVNSFGMPRIGFVHASGMLGKYLGIQSAKAELRRLFDIPNRNSYGNFRIGMHVRGPDEKSYLRSIYTKNSDFRIGEDIPQPGVWNMGLPLWYYKQAIALTNLFVNVPLNLQIFSNLKSKDVRIIEIKKFCEDLGIRTDLASKDLDLSIRQLTNSDLIIPSISSFSMLNLFLGDSRYLWPYKSLFNYQSSLSIWNPEDPETINLDSNANYFGVKGRKIIRGFPIRFDFPENYNLWLNDIKTNSEFLDLLNFDRLPLHFLNLHS